MITICNVAFPSVLSALAASSFYAAPLTSQSYRDQRVPQHISKPFSQGCLASNGTRHVKLGVPLPLPHCHRLELTAIISLLSPLLLSIARHHRLRALAPYPLIFLLNTLLSPSSLTFTMPPSLFRLLLTTLPCTVTDRLVNTCRQPTSFTPSLVPTG